METIPALKKKKVNIQERDYWLREMSPCTTLQMCPAFLGTTKFVLNTRFIFSLLCHPLRQEMLFKSKDFAFA